MRAASYYFSSTVRSRKGFTLIETMVGFSILGLLGASVGLAILQNRKLAESNVFETTALTVAQGFIEQIKAMDYTTIAESVDAFSESPSRDVPLPTLGARSSSGGGADIESQPLKLSFRNPVGVTESGVWKGVLYDIVRDASGTALYPRYMRMWATPTALKVADRDAYEITINFEWDARDISPTAVPRSASVRIVKSNVPTF